MSDLINSGHPFATSQATDLGITRKQLYDAVRTHRLRRVLRGVYIDARAVDDRSTRVRAIALVCPDEAIVCNETAAWLHGLDVFPPALRHSFEPSLVIPHATTRVERNGVRGRQSLFRRGDIDFVDGVYVTSPVRTVSDLLRRLYRPYALAAADAFAHAGLVGWEEVNAYVAELKGYRGIVQARSLASIIEPRTESPGESWLRLRIVDAGFPHPVSQFVVEDGYNGRNILDLAYPELLIGSEFDGREFHTDPTHVAHDDERRSYLSSRYGWRWVNATRERIFGTDDSFEHELGTLLGITPLSRRWGHRAATLSPAVSNPLLSGD